MQAYLVKKSFRINYLVKLKVASFLYLGMNCRYTNKAKLNGL